MKRSEVRLKVGDKVVLRCGDKREVTGRGTINDRESFAVDTRKSREFYTIDGKCLRYRNGKTFDIVSVNNEAITDED